MPFCSRATTCRHNDLGTTLVERTVRFSLSWIVHVHNVFSFACEFTQLYVTVSPEKHVFIACQHECDGHKYSLKLPRNVAQKFSDMFRLLGFSMQSFCLDPALGAATSQKFDSMHLKEDHLPPPPPAPEPPLPRDCLCCKRQRRQRDRSGIGWVQYGQCGVLNVWVLQWLLGRQFKNLDTWTW